VEVLVMQDNLILFEDYDPDYDTLAEYEAMQKIPNDKTVKAMEDARKENSDIEKELRSLAELTPIEYDHVRAKKAKELKVRTKTLDSEVEKLRPKPEVEGTPDELVNGIEPCGYSVNGNQLASTIRNSLNKHLVLPKGADTAITLWIMASYQIDSFRIFPKLCLSSPEKRCGKTTTLEVIQAFSNRSLLSANLSASVMFRAIEVWKPTLLIDEADSFLDGKEELRGIINSGHTKSGAYVLRSEKVDDEWTPVKFSTWCPMVIAMIKKPPSTIIDRSVMIELQRKKIDEITERIPLDFIDDNKKIRSELMQWATDTRITNAFPDMPQLSSDRAMDNWSPLIAVADTIGWNEASRQAMIILNLESEDDIAIETKLLADIQEVFANKDRMFSSDLVQALISDEDNIWCEWKHGKPMTANSLSRLLKPYKINPKNMRIGLTVKKGYALSQFKDTFKRYLSNNPDSKRYTATIATDKALQHNQNVTNNNHVAVSNSLKPTLHKGCSGVADEMPVSEGNCEVLL